MRVVPLAAVVVVFAAAGAGWWYWDRARADQAANTEVQELLAAADVEFGRDDLARPEASAVLRRVRDHRLAADPRLVRTRSRLELLLGRAPQAWQTLMPLANALAPQRPDMLLAARILLRLHGIRGDIADVEHAMHLAGEAYAQQEDVSGLFLAWQCARRAGRSDDVARFSGSLAASYGDSAEARVVNELSTDAPSLDKLLELEIEFDRRAPDLPFGGVPVELEFGIAVALARAGAEDQLVDALGRTDRVLATFPASVDARHMAAVLLHFSGDQEKRDLHLDWLLANAPDSDTRREQWRALLGQPAGSGR